MVATPMTGELYGFERDKDPAVHFAYMNPAPGNGSAGRSHTEVGAVSTPQHASKPVVASCGGTAALDSVALAAVPYVHDFWRGYYTTQTQPAVPAPPTGAAAAISDPPVTVFQATAKHSEKGQQGKQKQKQKQKQKAGNSGACTANQRSGGNSLTVVIVSETSYSALITAGAARSSSKPEFIFCNGCGGCCGLILSKGLYVCGGYVLVDCVGFYGACTSVSSWLGKQR